MYCRDGRAVPHHARRLLLIARVGCSRHAHPPQLFLPHASDAGTVKRILLRDGAAVTVRGARSVRLRRGLDLPAIGLSEFAG